MVVTAAGFVVVTAAFVVVAAFVVIALLDVNLRLMEPFKALVLVHGVLKRAHQVG